MSITVTVSELSKSFGTHPALTGISLTFEHAKLHGLIGAEGAGKTTLLRLIAGLLRVRHGSIRYHHQAHDVPFREIRTHIASMPGRQSLYADLSIAEHLEFFSHLYGLSREDDQETRKRLLALTRLEPFLDRRAGQLSGGMYKKLGLMCALMAHPQLLLLDEPTNGVDPISRREFWELLYGLVDEGITIIVSTSYMDEAERCHHVHLLDNGRTIASGEPRKLLADAGVSSFDAYYLAQTRTHPHAEVAPV